MAALSDFFVAMKMRDIIKQLVRTELRKSGLVPIYGVVQSIDSTGGRAEVLLNGESAPVWVVMNSIQPSAVGQTVRILGGDGDMYIDNVVGSGSVVIQGNSASTGGLVPPAPGLDAGPLLQLAIDALGGNPGSVTLAPGHFVHADTLFVGAGQRFVSEVPDGAIIEYSGTDRNVVFRGRMTGARGVKFLTTNAAATVKNVVIDAPVSDTLSWRLLDCTISATTRTTGQSGLYFENTVTTNIYYGQMVGGKIENYGTGVSFAGNNAVTGINGNNFVGVSINNCDTLIDFYDTYANVFTALQGDLFTLGIRFRAGSIRCGVFGRFEGGTGSQCYIDAGQENYGIIDDNCVVASDFSASLGNQITSVAIGLRKAWDVPPAWMANFDPLLANAFGTIPNAANCAQFVRIEHTTMAVNITVAKVVIGTSSGNIAVGLYEYDGATFTRVATTGSIACPAAGLRVLTFLAGHIIDPRKIYFAEITADNTTATFRSFTITDQATIDVRTPNILGAQFYATTAGGMFPPPATAALSDTTHFVPGATTDSKAILVEIG